MQIAPPAWDSAFGHCGMGHGCYNASAATSAYHLAVGRAGAIIITEAPSARTLANSGRMRVVGGKAYKRTPGHGA